MRLLHLLVGEGPLKDPAGLRALAPAEATAAMTTTTMTRRKSLRAMMWPAGLAAPDDAAGRSRRARTTRNPHLVMGPCPLTSRKQYNASSAVVTAKARLA